MADVVAQRRATAARAQQQRAWLPRDTIATMVSSVLPRPWCRRARRRCRGRPGTGTVPRWRTARRARRRSALEGLPGLLEHRVGQWLALGVEAQQPGDINHPVVHMPALRPPGHGPEQPARTARRRRRSSLAAHRPRPRGPAWRGAPTAPAPRARLLAHVQQGPWNPRSMTPAYAHVKHEFDNRPGIRSGARRSGRRRLPAARTQTAGNRRTRPLRRRACSLPGPAAVPGCRRAARAGPRPGRR